MKDSEAKTLEAKARKLMETATDVSARGVKYMEVGAYGIAIANDVVMVGLKGKNQPFYCSKRGILDVEQEEWNDMIKIMSEQ